MSRPQSTAAGTRRRTRSILRELWRARSVLWVLIRRDLKLRYADSVLGYVWTVLEPLMMGTIYWFVFTKIFHRSVGEDPYIIFLLTGLLPWMWFTNALNEGAKAITSQRRLVASTALPRQIWVLRTEGAKALEFLFSLPVLGLFLLFYPPQYDAQLLLLPLGILVQLLLLMGLGLLLAPVTMLVRDVEPIIRIATRALFYASPIIYSYQDVIAARLPAVLRTIYALNPVTGIMECFRAGFFAGPVQSGVIVSAAIFSLVVFVLGWVVFVRLEHRMLKEV